MNSEIYGKSNRPTDTRHIMARNVIPPAQTAKDARARPFLPSVRVSRRAMNPKINEARDRTKPGG